MAKTDGVYSENETAFCYRTMRTNYRYVRHTTKRRIGIVKNGFIVKHGDRLCTYFASNDYLFVDECVLIITSDNNRITGVTYLIDSPHNN